MLFDNNMAYQIYRVLISIFGTLGMLISTTPMKNSHKKNLLILGGYAVYAVVVSSLSIRFLGFLTFMRSAAYRFPARCSDHLYGCGYLTFKTYLYMSVTAPAFPLSDHQRNSAQYTFRRQSALKRHSALYCLSCFDLFRIFPF